MFLPFVPDIEIFPDRNVVVPPRSHHPRPPQYSLCVEVHQHRQLALDDPDVKVVVVLDVEGGGPAEGGEGEGAREDGDSGRLQGGREGRGRGD